MTKPRKQGKYIDGELHMFHIDALGRTHELGHAEKQSVQARMIAFIERRSN